MRLDAPVFVAGARGLVGSAVVRRLIALGHTNVLTPRRSELDLQDRASVRAFFHRHAPTHVVLAAARVGGILANRDFPADFIRDNLEIQLNVIDEAYRAGVEKLLFLGSSCIYPKLAPQPITEDALLTGPLEPTNEPYAIAKIAGLKLCEAYNRQYGTRYIAAMPTNLYGPGDNFDPLTSHVLPGLMVRFHEAKLAGSDEVVVWGTGRPRREFLYVDDVADALVLLLREYEGEALVNVGCGEDVSIAELAALAAEVVGFTGRIAFDPSKPDGTPRKLLDVSRLFAMGWRPRVGLAEGMRRTYEWLLRDGMSADAAGSVFVSSGR